MKVKSLILLCLMLCAAFIKISLDFYALNHTAFGMSDVDRYMSWLSGEKIESKALVVHYFVISLLRSTPNPQYMLNLIVPTLVWLVIPMLLLKFYNTLDANQEDNVIRVVFFMFGTFTLLFFQYTALWAELLAFVLFLLALTYRRSYVFLPLAFVSVLAHPMMLGVWCIYLFAALINHRLWVIVLSLGVVALFLVFASGAYSILTPFSDYQGSESGLYMMFYVYTCPLLILFLFLGRADYEFKTFAWMLFLIAPFIQIGRGLPFAHIFLAYYALQGYRRLRELVGPVFYWLTFLLVFLWLDSFWAHIQHNFLLELVLRGLT